MNMAVARKKAPPTTATKEQSSRESCSERNCQRNESVVLRESDTCRGHVHKRQTVHTASKRVSVSVGVTHVPLRSGTDFLRLPAGVR